MNGSLLYLSECQVMGQTWAHFLIKQIQPFKLKFYLNNDKEKIPPHQEGNSRYSFPAQGVQLIELGMLIFPKQIFFSQENGNGLQRWKEYLYNLSGKQKEKGLRQNQRHKKKKKNGFPHQSDKTCLTGDRVCSRSKRKSEFIDFSRAVDEICFPGGKISCQTFSHTKDHELLFIFLSVSSLNFSFSAGILS